MQLAIFQKMDFEVQCFSRNANNMGKMKRKFFPLLILIILIVVTNQQRSRGPPHGKGQSFQSGTPPPPSGKGLGMGQSTKNCQIINGVNSCDQPSRKVDYKFTSFIIAIILTICGFMYMKKRDIDTLKKIFKKEMQDFEKKIQEIPCKMKQADFNIRKLAFQNANFKMDDLRKDKIEHYKSQLRIVNIDKVNPRIYQIKYQCKDINGQGYFQGLLAIVNKNQFALKMVKVYKKFTEMGTRTKKIKNLMFYEGRGSLKSIKGSWHFIGYEDTQSHSGTWQMISF